MRQVEDDTGGPVSILESREKVDWDVFVEAFAETNLDGSPKYLRICNVVRDMISSGRWAEKEQLPPEQQFSQEIGVSLGTVQRALGLLADEGTVVRVQGHGTFVSPAGNSVLSGPWNLRFVRGSSDELLAVRTKIVSRSVIDTPENERWFFENSPRLIRLVREVIVDEELTCLNYFYMPEAELAPILDLPEEQLNDVDIRQMLAEKFGYQTRRISHRFRCQTMPEETATHLGLADGSYSVVLIAYGRTSLNKPIYHQVTYIPPSDIMVCPPIYYMTRSRA